MKDAINPDHYKVGGIEAIDYVKAKLSPEEYRGYCKGNIIKYLSRSRHKGTEAQDYEKALWYCGKLVEAANQRPIADLTAPKPAAPSKTNT